MAKDRGQQLINENKPYFLLRNAYCKALIREGLLEKVELSDEIIIEEKKENHCVTLTDLPCENKKSRSCRNLAFFFRKRKAWFFNDFKNDRSRNFGLYTRRKSKYNSNSTTRTQNFIAN